VNGIVIVINKLGLMMTRKPTYEELEKEVKELKEESADRKQMERALQKSSEKIKLFAYSVSHDLKSPAIGLYGLTKRLYKDYADILDAKGKKYCEQILKTAEQIAALVEQINIFISTKEAPLTIERLALKEVLQVIREEFSSQLSIRKIRWSEPDYIREIKADRLCMIRALRNLVDNALKYGGEALSEINIKYRGSGGSHILSIKDNGLGLIEQDSHQDIFAPFIRRKTSKGIQGSGLGLNIVREIAEKHGGEVWLEPGRERGITFYISIPKNLQL
jgi:signal transduction histidine kinase